MISRSPATKSVALGLLLVAVAFTFLPFLGCTPFYSKGEPREAVVALSMLQSGDWILPVSNGDVIPYKPPFLAWCIAGISLLTGEVTEYTSRFPSAVALIIMIVATYSFWHRRIGEGVAMVGSIITFTCFEVYRAGFACRVDMMLTMFIVTSLYSLYVWAMDERMRGLPLGALLLMSGGVLTKGPVAIVLPCIIIWLLVGWTRRGLWECTWKLILTAILALVIPSMWYVAAWAQGGRQFIDLVIEENFGRMTGTMSYDSHVNPWWYNVVTLIGGIAPYTLLLLIAAIAWPFRKQGEAKVRFSDKIRSYGRRLSQAEPATIFLFLAPAAIFLFYCFPASKRSVYLLPMYPFIGMLVAWLIVSSARRGEGLVKWFTVIIALISILAFIVFVSLQFNLIYDEICYVCNPSLRDIYELSVGVTWWKWCLVSLSALTALIVLFRTQRDSAMTTILGMCMTILTLYWAFGAVYQPAAVNWRSDKLMALDIAELQPEGPIQAFVATDMLRFFTADFYTGDRIVPFDIDKAPSTGYLLCGDDDFGPFKARMEGRVSFKTVARWPFDKSCDIRQPVTLYQYEIIDFND